MVEHSLRNKKPDTHKSSLTQIIYLTDFFPLPNSEHQLLFESFIEKLEASLGVKRIEVNLAQLWKDNFRSESGATDLPLQEFMKQVRSRLVFNSPSFRHHHDL